MARLILLLLFIAALAIVAATVASAVRAVADGGPGSRSTKEMPMPAAIQTIAYILLVLLLFGVATGLIGGL